MNNPNSIGGNRPVFEFRQVLDVGTRNPIVARLGLQTANLLQWIDISDATINKIKALYLEKLLHGLVNCLKTRDEIAQRGNEAIETAEKFPSQGAIHVPTIIGLEKLAGDFLYGAKNYLRDLLQLLDLLYGKKFDGASAWSELKKDGKTPVGRWAETRFGPNHRMVRLLTQHADVIRQLVRLRNAMEHPGGLSGDIVIENIKRNSQAPGQYLAPTWQRINKDPYGPSDIIADMDTSMRVMLNLGEEMVAEAVLDNPKSPLVSVGEIAVSDRDEACPIRLQITLSVPQT